MELEVFDSLVWDSAPHQGLARPDSMDSMLPNLASSPSRKPSSHLQHDRYQPKLAGLGLLGLLDGAAATGSIPALPRASPHAGSCGALTQGRHHNFVAANPTSSSQPGTESIEPRRRSCPGSPVQQTTSESDRWWKTARSPNPALSARGAVVVTGGPTWHCLAAVVFPGQRPSPSESGRLYRPITRFLARPAWPARCVTGVRCSPRGPAARRRMPRARQREHRTNTAHQRSTTCPVLRRPHRAVAPARAEFPSLSSRAVARLMSGVRSREMLQPIMSNPVLGGLPTVIADYEFDPLASRPLSSPQREEFRRRGLVRANDCRPGEALPSKQSRSGGVLPDERGFNLSLCRAFSDLRAGRVKMGAAVWSQCLVSDLFSGSELPWHFRRRPRCVWALCGSPSPLCSATCNMGWRSAALSL